MASGPEHYRKAEHLLKGVVKTLDQVANDPAVKSAAGTVKGAEIMLAAAAVHAQLADVAIQYDIAIDGINNEKEWSQTTAPTEK